MNRSSYSHPKRDTMSLNSTTSLKNYDEKYRNREDKVIDDWKMGKKVKEMNEKDGDLKYFQIEFIEKIGIGIKESHVDGGLVNH